MPVYPSDHASIPNVNISPEVLDYIEKRNCDFRICTSCGGPILLPARIKPPKKSDILIKAGSHTIYISIHQVRFLQEIRSDIIPFFDNELTGHERG